MNANNFRFINKEDFGLKANNLENVDFFSFSGECTKSRSGFSIFFSLSFNYSVVTLLLLPTLPSYMLFRVAHFLMLMPWKLLSLLPFLSSSLCRSLSLILFPIIYMFSLSDVLLHQYNNSKLKFQQNIGRFCGQTSM